MRVERGEHAVDGADDHLVLVRLIDIGRRALGPEHPRKQRQMVLCFAGASALGVACEAPPPAKATASAPQAMPAAR